MCGRLEWIDWESELELEQGPMKGRETLTAISPDKEINREVEQAGRRWDATSPSLTPCCRQRTTSDTRASLPLTCRVGHQPKTLLGRDTWRHDAPRNDEAQPKK